MTSPATRPPCLLGPALLFAACAVLLVLGMTRNLNVYDEGVILTGAMRVAAGDIPHADFYANYGPGQFYVLAALFKVLGTSAMVERLYDALMRAAIVAILYAIVADVAGRRLAFACAAISFLWLYAVRLYGYPLIPVTLLCIAAAALIQPALRGEDSRRRLFGAGACVGVATLFRYDVGPVAFATLAAMLAWSAVTGTNGRATAARRAVASIGAFALGAIAAFVPVAVLYLSVAPLGRFVFDLFEYSIPNYARMRSLPFPRPLDILADFDRIGVYLPMLACALAAASFIAARPRASDRRDGFIATFALLAATMYLKGLVRVGNAHLLASILPSVVAITVLLPRVASQGRALRIAAMFVAAVGVASAVTAAAVTAQRHIEDQSSVLAKILAVAGSGSPWCPTPPELHNIECLLLDPDREAAARIVATHTAPGERIFVGLTRHDKVFISDITMYFATDRMPATHWHHFDPGLQTRADIQGEMIGELRRRAVRWAVLESAWDWIEEPNDSAKSSGVHLLDDYLRKHYRPVAKFGEISLWLRDPAIPG
ncbi:MAG TPA: glycosyltransferase family 39 protein [Usitatibacter sp.]|nr:glycosyltransferase family 39 protein [Usitatibacter sp.]